MILNVTGSFMETIAWGKHFCFHQHIKATSTFIKTSTHKIVHFANDYFIIHLKTNILMKSPDRNVEKDETNNTVDGLVYFTIHRLITLQKETS